MCLTLEAFRVDLVDVLRAGGPGRKPAAGGYDFQPANRSLIAWGTGQFGGNWLACQIRFPHRIGRELLQFCFLLWCSWGIDARVIRRSEFCRQFAVVFSGIPACPGRNLGCQQIHDGPVLVSRPHRTVVAKKARSSTLLSAETIRSINETWHKPFETDRHFAELAAELIDDAVNHAAAHQ